MLREKTDLIAGKVRDLIPGLRFKIDHRWAGAFGDSDTGLPFIDRVPGHPNCYAIMGFGGNGITYSMIAAEMIAKLMAGRDDPDQHFARLRDGPRTFDRNEYLGPSGPGDFDRQQLHIPPGCSRRCRLEHQCGQRDSDEIPSTHLGSFAPMWRSVAATSALRRGPAMLIRASLGLPS